MQRPSLIVRLARFAPLETLFCVFFAILGGYGTWAYAAFQRNPLAAEITPLAFFFGVWPFILVLAVAAGLGTWAVVKARV